MRDYRKKLETYSKRELPIILPMADQIEYARLLRICLYILTGMLAVGCLVAAGLDPII